MSDECASILVRVAPEILEHLKAGDVEPVVVLGVTEQPDGTYDMTLKVPDRAAPGQSPLDATCPTCGRDRPSHWAHHPKETT